MNSGAESSRIAVDLAAVDGEQVPDPAPGVGRRCGGRRRELLLPVRLLAVLRLPVFLLPVLLLSGVPVLAAVRVVADARFLPAT